MLQSAESIAGLQRVAGVSEPACEPAPATEGEGPFGISPIRDHVARIVLGRRMEDHALDSGGLYQARCDATSLGHPCHYRGTLVEGVGKGQAEFCAVADGFYVLISDMAYDAPFVSTGSVANILRIRIASAADAEIQQEGEETVTLEGPGVCIAIDPADSPPVTVPTRGRDRLVCLMIHRDALARACTAGEEEMPNVVRDFLAGTLERRFLRTLPLDPEFLRCFEELHSCTLKRAGRRMFIQAKAMEILSRMIDVLAEEEDCSSELETSPTMMRGVIKAQRILAEDLVAPPSIEHLARSVGLSRSSLCAGFRRIVGTTVFGYLTDLRMQQALKLLKDRDATIAEIARAVGFSHTSGFSVAVQRRFGTSPRELRRRRSSPS